MNLRFDVDQAESFRRGVECPKSFHMVEVYPDKIDKELRVLIAKRMIGIDVCRLTPAGIMKAADGSLVKVRAATPTWTGFVNAVLHDERCLTHADWFYEI